MNLRRNKPVVGLGIVACAFALAGAAQVTSQQGQPAERAEAQQAEAKQTDTDAERIGVVDNARVFEAYPPAQEFNQQVMAVQQEFAQAQQQGDQQRLREIQARFTRMQEELRERFESDLETASRELAGDREIDMVVSAVLYAPESVEEVDLTEQMIEVIADQQETPEQGMPEPGTPGMPRD